MRLLHNLKYLSWLAGQIVLAAGAVIIDAPRRRTQLDPAVVAYPLRVTSPQAIGAFTTSITVTPGTLSLGLLLAGDPLPADVARISGPHEPVAVGTSSATSGGMDGSQHERHRGRVLLVHAVFGTDPASVMADLADMEERLDPTVKQLTQPVDPQGAYARMFHSAPAPSSNLSTPSSNLTPPSSDARKDLP